MTRTRVESDKVLSLYRDHAMSMIAISKALGCAYRTVWQIVKDAGLTRSRNDAARKDVQMRAGIALVKKGRTVSEAAREVGVSRRGLYYHLNPEGTRKRKSPIDPTDRKVRKAWVELALEIPPRRIAQAWGVPVSVVLTVLQEKRDEISNASV